MASSQVRWVLETAGAFRAVNFKRNPCKQDATVLRGAGIPRADQPGDYRLAWNRVSDFCWRRGPKHFVCTAVLSVLQRKSYLVIFPQMERKVSVRKTANQIELQRSVVLTTHGLHRKENPVPVSLPRNLFLLCTDAMACSSLQCL
jgi:hypothetical protein